MGIVRLQLQLSCVISELLWNLNIIYVFSIVLQVQAEPVLRDCVVGHHIAASEPQTEGIPGVRGDGVACHCVAAALPQIDAIRLVRGDVVTCQGVAVADIDIHPIHTV